MGGQGTSPAGVAGRGARARLDRDRVLAAALALVDREGLDALSMRRLGAELGVEAMSIYNHVPDKGAILDGLCEVMLAELGDGGVEGDWREVARVQCVRFREVGRRHPAAFSLFSTRPIGAYASARDLSEAMLSGLRAAGFDRATAIMAYRTVVRYVLGFVLAEVAVRTEGTGGGAPVSERAHPLFAEMLVALRDDDADGLFTFGLDVLLDGLAARLHAPPAEVTPRS